MLQIDLETEIKKLAKKGWELEIRNEIKSGKEAIVYLVKDVKAKSLKAFKVYKPDHSFNRFNEYMEGTYISDKFNRAVARKSKEGKKFIAESRVLREFNMIKKFYDLKCSVPIVYDYSDYGILMEYLGDETSHAPRLIEVNLTKEEAKTIWKKVLFSLIIFTENGVVHADLSPYNILFWNKDPYIIDFPQAVDMRFNPHTANFLERDIENIINYFDRYEIVSDIEKEALRHLPKTIPHQ